MGVHSFKVVQQIPVDLDRAWLFFSDPANLQQLTPAYMQMRVISSHHGKFMYPGQIIEYRVKPVLNIPWYWMTEITHVADRKFFVDEQRYGPYALWHHQHHFVEVEDGVEMTDIVHYKVAFGFLGEWANTLWVRKELERIFKYRRQQIEQIFGTL